MKCDLNIDPLHSYAKLVIIARILLKKINNSFIFLALKLLHFLFLSTSFRELANHVSLYNPLENRQMKSLEELFCESAKSMTPYSPIEPPDQVATRLGIDENEIIKLDANENPYGTSNTILTALSEGSYYHIYPDPAQVQLREAIAEYVRVDPDMIIAGTGADEIIDIVCRLILEPGEEVIGFVPTFSYYPHVVTLNRGRYVAIEREKDYSISLDKAKSLNLDRCKLVILCSPNNPSGNLVEEEVLNYFLDQNLIVMLDEAYFEFSGISYLEKVKKHKNLIVLRTFSKCFALAGLRVGYGVGEKSLVSALMKIKPPFSVNVAAEVAIKTCLQNLSHYREQVSTIIKTREWTLDKLNNFKQLEVYPSHSNFILCKVNNYDAGQLSKDLEQKGILVRYFDNELLHNSIRISVGTEQQMKTFVEKLSDFIS